MSIMQMILDFLKKMFSKGETNMKTSPVVKETSISIDTTNSLKWSWIVVHHSATVDGKTNEWDSMKAYQMSWRYNDNAITEEKAKSLIASGVKSVIKPDRDIAYNYGIENINNQFIYKIGRPLTMKGAHAIGFNDKAIGICVVGCFDLKAPSQEQYDMLAKLCRDLQRTFNISKSHVIGHRETYIMRNVPIEKSCPGKQFSCDYLRSVLI